MPEFDSRTELERKLEEEERQRAQAASGAPPNPYGATFNVQAPPPPQRQKSTLEKWREKGGILGRIAVALMFIAKVGAPVFALLGKLKFLLIFKGVFFTLISMAVSIWAYSTRFGLAFGIGIVALIFIHESGHAIAGMMRGLKPGLMVFIPFMGAFVTIKGHGENLEQDAFIGIMGPVFGTLASVASLAMFFATQNQFWLGLAFFGFFMNLFNLAPMAPLDGGWIAPLFSPKLLAFGIVLMIYFGLQNPLILVLGVVSIPRVIHAWKADPATQPYYRVSAAAKWKFGLAYVGLAAFLAAAMAICQGLMSGPM